MFVKLTNDRLINFDKVKSVEQTDKLRTYNEKSGTWDSVSRIRFNFGDDCVDVDFNCPDIANVVFSELTEFSYPPLK